MLCTMKPDQAHLQHGWGKRKRVKQQENQTIYNEDLTVGCSQKFSRHLTELCLANKGHRKVISLLYLTHPLFNLRNCSSRHQDCGDVNKTLNTSVAYLFLFLSLLFFPLPTSLLQQQSQKSRAEESQIIDNFQTNKMLFWKLTTPHNRLHFIK